MKDARFDNFPEVQKNDMLSTLDLLVQIKERSMCKCGTGETSRIWQQRRQFTLLLLDCGQIRRGKDGRIFELERFSTGWLGRPLGENIKLLLLIVVPKSSKK